MIVTTDLDELLTVTLDELPITDTVFHDLKHSGPLALELLARIPSKRSRILLIGPNVALAVALDKLHHDVTLWHVPTVALTEDLLATVERTGTFDELLTGTLERRFDVVVAPYVLESATAPPVDALSGLSRLLDAGGRLLLVYRRAEALDRRIEGLRGRSPFGARARARGKPSWSWPAAPLVRLVDDPSLQAWSTDAGMRLVDATPVIDRRAVEQVSALTLRQWAAGQLRHAVKARVPALRDVGVAVLVPLEIGRPSASLGPDPQCWPTVSVLVAVRDLDRTTALVGDVAAQTYPLERIEVLLCGAPSMGGALPLAGSPVPVRVVEDEDPGDTRAFDRALAEASGDVVALTDDWCRLPPGWVEAGVRAMGGYTAGLAGRVLADAASATPFLALPGRHRDSLGTGVFPGASSFWSRQALVEVGGFEQRRLVGRSRWGWDTAAAIALQRAGYRTAEEPTAYLFRHYAPPPDRGWLAQEYAEARAIPHRVRQLPELRSTVLHRRWFASERTFAFDLATAGVVLAVVTGRRLPALATIAWYRSASEYLDFWPPRQWPTSLRHLRGMALRNVVWAAGLLHGSVEARRVVL